MGKAFSCPLSAKILNKYEEIYFANFHPTNSNFIFQCFQHPANSILDKREGGSQSGNPRTFQGHEFDLYTRSLDPHGARRFLITSSVSSSANKKPPLLPRFIAPRESLKHAYADGTRLEILNSITTSACVKSHRITLRTKNLDFRRNGAKLVQSRFA